MPKPILGAGPAYAHPPASLRLLSEDLYQYLFMLHVRTFGIPEGRGDLDRENIALSTLSLGDLGTRTHALFSGLAADDHGAIYLNLTRHNAIGGNPHQVTASEVGKDTAQWNANRLQGFAVNATTPTANQVLTWDVLTATWLPQPSSVSGPVSSVFGRTGVVVAATNDYTWAQIDKTVSSIADLTTRLTTDVTEGTNLY